MNYKKKNALKPNVEESAKREDTQKGKLQNISFVSENRNEKKKDKQNQEKNELKNTRISDLTNNKYEEDTHKERNDDTVSSLAYNNVTKNYPPFFQENEVADTIKDNKNYTKNNNIFQDPNHFENIKSFNNNISDSVDIINNSISNIKNNLSNLKNIVKLKKEEHEEEEEEEEEEKESEEEEEDKKGETHFENDSSKVDSSDNTSENSSDVMTFEKQKEDSEKEKTEEEFKILLKEVMNTKKIEPNLTTLDIVDQCISIGNTHSTKKSNPYKNTTNINNTNVESTNKSDLNNKWLKQKIPNIKAEDKKEQRKGKEKEKENEQYSEKKIEKTLETNRNEDNDTFLKTSEGENTYNEHKENSNDTNNNTIEKCQFTESDINLVDTEKEILRNLKNGGGNEEASKHKLINEKDKSNDTKIGIDKKKGKTKEKEKEKGHEREDTSFNTKCQVLRKKIFILFFSNTSVVKNLLSIINKHKKISVLFLSTTILFFCYASIPFILAFKRVINHTAFDQDL